MIDRRARGHYSVRGTMKFTGSSSLVPRPSTRPGYEARAVHTTHAQFQPMLYVHTYSHVFEANLVISMPILKKKKCYQALKELNNVIIQ